MKKLIENVNFPSDCFVSYKQVIENLEKRGCQKSEIEFLKEIIKGKQIYDFSGYSGVSTLVIIDSNNIENNICIKISDIPHKLKGNFIVSNFLAQNGLSPKVIKYISTNKDYLILEALSFPMALNAFSNFRLLSEFMGKSLRKFHDINWNQINMDIQVMKYFLNKTNDFIAKAISHKNGLSFLAKYQNDYDYSSMKTYLKDNSGDYNKYDVLIHGDFNPRNVFVGGPNSFILIDFEDTCFGDRHYDIYFSIWTIALYTGIIDNKELIKECEEIFLTEYGKDKIDYKRLMYCQKLACMYWQEHNDINGIV